MNDNTDDNRELDKIIEHMSEKDIKEFFSDIIEYDSESTVILAGCRFAHGGHEPK